MTTNTFVPTKPNMKDTYSSQSKKKRKFKVLEKKSKKS